MSDDTKKQKQIMVRPSVLKKSKEIMGKVGAVSFSDLVEKLILEKCNEQD